MYNTLLINIVRIRNCKSVRNYESGTRCDLTPSFGFGDGNLFGYLCSPLSKCQQMKTKGIVQNKVNIVTLGRSKNLVDSENILTQLRANQFDVEHESKKDDAQIVIVNTCGFIDSAKQESIGRSFALCRCEGQRPGRQIVCNRLSFCPLQRRPGKGNSPGRRLFRH